MGKNALTGCCRASENEQTEQINIKHLLYISNPTGDSELQDLRLFQMPALPTALRNSACGHTVCSNSSLLTTSPESSQSLLAPKPHPELLFLSHAFLQTGIFPL